MTQIYLTTTGTVPVIKIRDLGDVEYIHPVNKLALISKPGAFRVDEILGSKDLESAIARGELKLVTDTGTSIVQIRRINTQSISNAFWTKIDFDTVDWEIDDTKLKVNDTSNAIEILEDGVYLASVFCSVDATTQIRAIDLNNNIIPGSEFSIIVSGGALSNNTNSASKTFAANLSAGDELSIQSKSTLATGSALESFSLCVTKIQ